jgi:hypothetical protein
MSTLLPLSMESGFISFMKKGTVRSMPASIIAYQRSKHAPHSGNRCQVTGGTQTKKGRPLSIPSDIIT